MACATGRSRRPLSSSGRKPVLSDPKSPTRPGGDAAAAGGLRPRPRSRCVRTGLLNGRGVSQSRGPGKRGREGGGGGDATLSRQSEKLTRVGDDDVLFSASREQTARTRTARVSIQCSCCGDGGSEGGRKGSSHLLKKACIALVLLTLILEETDFDGLPCEVEAERRGAAGDLVRGASVDKWCVVPCIPVHLLLCFASFGTPLLRRLAGVSALKGIGARCIIRRRTAPFRRPLEI